MRLKTLALMAALPICAACATPQLARGQNPDTMMPEESAAKAKQILQQLIQALGGPSYLRIREALCEGRLAQFGHNGELTGYINFKDFWRYPDKNRTEYSKKGEIIDLYNGDQGWTLDKGGVSEEAASNIADFQEQVKTDIDNLLRIRLKEDGMIFRYGGSDLVDLKQVDWVEIVDADRRTFRLAIDREKHLLARAMVITRNDTTRERTEETTFYSNYHPVDGVETPLQIERQRDGRRVYQAFYTSCKYNPGFPDELFTRASLDKRASEFDKKKKKK